MAAPNVNGRLHLTCVHQKSPASFTKKNIRALVAKTVYPRAD